MRTPIDEIRAIRESCLETTKDRHSGEEVKVWTSAWEYYEDAFDNAEGLVTRLVNAHERLVESLREMVQAIEAPENVVRLEATEKARAVLAEMGEG